MDKQTFVFAGENFGRFHAQAEFGQYFPPRKLVFFIHQGSAAAPKKTPRMGPQVNHKSAI